MNIKTFETGTILSHDFIVKAFVLDTSALENCCHGLLRLKLFISGQNFSCKLQSERLDIFVGQSKELLILNLV